jgi:uncharacterized protein
MSINPKGLITKYYQNHPLAQSILLEHSEAVANKAVAIARKLNLPEKDCGFIDEATMLHDIGMIFTHAPSIGCKGNKPYICHGYLGHDLLKKEGWPEHALVCERHTGTGLTIDDIKRQNLPLPHRDMMPLSLPEQIITYADKFFSKDPGQLGTEQALEKVRNKLLRHGPDKLQIFDNWHQRFR